MSNTDLQKRVEAAIRNPKNMGELQGADAIGTVGNSGCGEMLRLWIKFKEDRGRKVIDQATFQSFGCETAIAVASLATELIRGKTPEEALSMSSEDLSGDLGPLPPMKIHCSQLVEEALRSALVPSVAASSSGTTNPSPASADVSSLLNNFGNASRTDSPVRIVLLNQDSAGQ